MTDSGTKPGWYPRPDMQDTLGFWDGHEWTDQTQPSRVTQQQRTNRGKWLAAAIVAALLVFVGWRLTTADSDLDCARKQAEAAQSGEPFPSCD